MQVLYTHFTMGGAGIDRYLAICQDATGDVVINLGNATYRIPANEIGDLPKAVTDAKTSADAAVAALPAP